jgi:cation:H+ antiporter
MSDLVFLCAGLAGLLLGGELLVRGAVSLSLHLALSPLVIGLVVVGFGTSTPELVTSLQAAFAGTPGIALGNVIGSNIANILLILGVGAVICPLRADWTATRGDVAMMLVASALACAVVLTGLLSRAIGVAFLGVLAGYLWLALRRPTPEVPPTGPAGSLPVACLLALGGLGVTLLAAAAAVSGATGLAHTMGVSEAVIGLTIIAVGTSLPELVATGVAAVRRQTDIALGNILGSNIFNALGILGVTGAIIPLEVPATIGLTDLGFLSGAAVLLALLLAVAGGISRLAGLGFLMIYALYMTILATGALS